MRVCMPVPWNRIFQIRSAVRRNGQHADWWQDQADGGAMPAATGKNDAGRIFCFAQLISLELHSRAISIAFFVPVRFMTKA